MQKPSILAAGLLLVLAGCQSQSPTWQKVVKVSHSTGDAENAPRVYAGELHRTLKEAGVPHKVVTFDFSYQGALHPFANTQRTAVIYQDSTSPRHPWWIMDRTLDRPVWLPEGTVENQVRFYLRRPAEIVSVSNFAGVDDKAIAETESPRRLVGTSRLEPASRVSMLTPEPARTTVKPERRRIFERGIFARRATPTQSTVAHDARTAHPPARVEPASEMRPSATTRLSPATAAQARHTPRRVSGPASTKHAPSKKTSLASTSAQHDMPPGANPPAPSADKKSQKDSPGKTGPATGSAPASAFDGVSSTQPAESTASQIAVPAKPQPGTRPKPALITAPQNSPAPPERPKEKKSRPPLITQPESPTSLPSAQLAPPRAETPGVFRRILSSLNPRRIFQRRTAG